MKFKDLPKDIQKEVIKAFNDFEEENGGEPMTDKEIIKIIKEENYRFKIEKDKYGQIFWEFMRED